MWGRIPVKDIGDSMIQSMHDYFNQLLFRYLSVYVRPGDIIHEINPLNDALIRRYRHGKAVRTRAVSEDHPGEDTAESPPDYLLLNGIIHYERDIQSFLDELRSRMSTHTRMVILYYNSLWKLVIQFASALGLRTKLPEPNWISPEDMENILELAGYEPVLDSAKILMPVYIPLISAFLNRYVAPLPFFRNFCLLHIMMARKQPERESAPSSQSVSIVVPARNEAGNIEDAVRRIPAMGPDDEIIFVYGDSADPTWETMVDVQRRYQETRHILVARQEGKGKGDAVRKGFALASKDILMILDADLSVPPERLPLFYRAIIQGKGEFINGSRLVYPMEGKAMRFINMIGNKFFAMAFSFVLGQRFKDTLCGTKVLTRDHYQKIAANRNYFGNFDPFGDFDLIFGAARLGLKIKEVPIIYRERTYGNTNIDRWRHGAILLRMLLFAARRIKFV